jgi:hypothetical protein
MKTNRNIYRKIAAGLGVVTVLAPMSAMVLPAQATPHGYSYGYAAKRLEAGTVVVIKLNDALNSRENRKGDTFTATVTTKDNDDDSALPIGTKVEGVVRSAKAKDGDNPGMLDLSFERVTLPNGRSYEIDGSPIALDNKSVVRQNGHLVAKNGNKGPDRGTLVGIGAGAGFLVNVLAHRKGTLLDTLVGAGLGYGAGALIKSGSKVRDVDLKVGSKIGFRLDRTLVLNRDSDYNNSEYRYHE